MGKGKQAFTLIEILLVISLIALFSTLFVLNLDSLLRSSEIETLENEYWRAVDAAKSGAVFTQRPHFIEWNEDEHRFVVKADGVVESFEVESDTINADTPIEVRFEEVAPENSYVLIRGELVSKRDIATVGFYPDGTCSPYVVTMKVAGYQTEFQMDPWTGVQLVNTEETRGGR